MQEQLISTASQTYKMASHYTAFADGKLRLNFCEEADMRVLPNVGRAAAEQMSGNITKENVLNIPNVKVSKQFLRMVDFTRNPAYSSVPCRTNLEKQEDKQRSTPSADCWEYQSAPSDASSKTPDSWSKSTGQSRQSSVGTQGSRPAYSCGGTPPCAMPVVVPSGPPNTGKKLYSRVTSTRKPTCSSQSVTRHRPAYSPGGTPARRRCQVRRPAYSPGGTPARSPVRTAAYSPEGTPARRRSTARRPAYSPRGSPACNKSPTQTPALQLMFSSDDSSSEDSSSDEPELVEADFAQERFLLASQAPEENLYEWADRLRVLAFKAFKGKSYSYINRLSVKQFCLECLDQEAGRYALDLKPETMDDALDYIKQCFMTYRQKQPQMSEASRPRDVTTDGQNTVQSQQNQLPAESPVCDSHITKSPVCDSNIIKSPVCDSLITRSPVRVSSSAVRSPVSDPFLSTGMVRESVNKEQQKPEKHNKSRKAKKAKAKKRKATREQSEPSSLAGNSKNLSEVNALQTDLLANSSRVDESKQYVLNENTTAKDIPLEEEVLVKATDEQQPGVYGILVHPSRPKYLVAMQLFESVSSIPDVTFDSAEMSLTEHGAVAPNALAITKQRCLYTKHRTITTLKNEESVSPCWNISEVTEGDTEEIKQSSTTETVNEEARFLEIERIIAEEIAYGTSVKQSSTTKAADEENLFTEIEQIIAAEIACETLDNQLSITEIAKEEENLFLEIEQIIAASERFVSQITNEEPADKNFVEAAVNDITIENIPPVSEVSIEVATGENDNLDGEMTIEDGISLEAGASVVSFVGKETKMEADASVDQDERKSEKSSISSQGEIHIKADVSVDNTAGQDDNPDGELTIEDGISLEAGASVDNFAGKETNMEADASVDRTAGQDERKPDEPPVDGQVCQNISIEAEVSVDNLVDQMAWIPADKERIPNLSPGDELMEDATSVEADASVGNPGDKQMMEDDIGIEADASITAETSVGEIAVAVSETNKEKIPNLSPGDEQMEDATSVEADASVDNPGDKQMMEDDIGIEADASITAETSVGEIAVAVSETNKEKIPNSSPGDEQMEAATSIEADASITAENSVGEIYVAVSETNILATRSSHSLMCIEFDQNNVNPEQTMLTANYMQDLGACMDPSLLRVTEGSQQCTATESKEEGSKCRDDKINLASGFEGLLAEDQTAVEQVLSDAGALDIEMVEDSSDLDKRERQPSAEVCDITHGVGIDTVSQSPNLDMNINQDDIQMVSTLESHLVRLGIENPVDHHAAGID